MLVQPTRLPGTAGMPTLIADDPDRPDPERPDNRTHAEVRQWAISGVLPYIAHQNPDAADQGLPGAAQDTKGPPTCSQDT